MGEPAISKFEGIGIFDRVNASIAPNKAVLRDIWLFYRGFPPRAQYYDLSRFAVEDNDSIGREQELEEVRTEFYSVENRRLPANLHD